MKNSTINELFIYFCFFLWTLFIIFSALIINGTKKQPSQSLQSLNNTETETETEIQKTTEELSTTTCKETETITEIVTEYEVESKTINIEEEYKKEISDIEASNEWEWFKAYKTISENYSNYIERDTIYDHFSTEELDLLFRIVESEVTGNTYFINKVNVASVIFNRLKSDIFPNDIIAVLTAPYQFSPYASGRYLQVEIIDATIMACEYAFEIGDTVSGALFFDSTKGNSWAHKNLSLIKTDEVGHSFYK